LSDPFGVSDSRAGFYYDLKFLIGLMYILFVVLIGISGFLFSIEIGEISIIFLSILTFLDLQAFVEVRVPRYGWKCSRFIYKLASALLLAGVLLVPIVNSLLNSGIIVELPQHSSIVLFFLSIGFLMIPILGMILTLVCYLDFAQSLGTSPWKRDKEIVEAISKHSFFYRKIFRRKR